jgi:hypothetical protein
MRRLLVCLALAAFAGPAAACINDSELPRHEREFKSQYRGNTPYLAPVTDSPTSEKFLIGGGGLLLSGAAALVLTGGRKRQ